MFIVFQMFDCATILSLLRQNTSAKVSGPRWLTQLSKKGGGKNTNLNYFRKPPETENNSQIWDKCGKSIIRHKVISLVRTSVCQEVVAFSPLHFNIRIQVIWQGQLSGVVKFKKIYDVDGGRRCITWLPKDKEECSEFCFASHESWHIMIWERF